MATLKEINLFLNGFNQWVFNYILKLYIYACSIIMKTYYATSIGHSVRI